MEWFIKILLVLFLGALFFCILRNKTFMQIYQFLIKPDFKKSQLGMQSKIWTVVKLSSTQALLALCFILLSMEELSLHFLNTFIVSEELLDFIDIILLTPIMEEFLFRYPLRKPISAITLPLSAALIKIKIVSLLPCLFLTQLLPAFLISLNKTKVIRFFIRHFKIYLILSIFLFSLLHMKQLEISWLIYFLFHIHSALMFSWIRVKFNFSYSILAHSLYNFYIWIFATLLENLT